MYPCLSKVMRNIFAKLLVLHTIAMSPLMSAKPQERFVAISGLFFIGIPVSASTQAHASRVEAALADLGSVVGNTYSNQFFGLKYNFPSGWIFDREATVEHNASEQLRGQQPDPKEREIYELWSSKSYVLLIASEFPQTRAPLRGPRLILRARTRLSWDKDETGLQGLTAIANHYRNESLGSTELIREPSEWTSGETKFACMATKSKVNQANQAPFSGVAITLRKGYWLEFDFSAKSLEELDGLFKSLNSIQFEQ